MLIRKLLAASALGLALIVPATSFAEETPPAQSSACILREHDISSVRPYTVEERVGKNTFRRLRGAELYVAAEPGLTAEWLRLTLGRHLASMRGPAGMKDCAFDVDDVRVEVDSAGSGFWVKLIAPDTAKGAEVLRRAQFLVGRSLSR